MILISSIQEVRATTEVWREEGQKIVLVPTMGWFHEGHLSLMRMAKTLGSRVVVSLFVNPIQFGPKEDLAAYPRDLERDRCMAEQEGIDVLFTPSVDEMFGPNFQTRISLSQLSQGLCGASRPGHFDGVATIVAKLFHLTSPHVAIFGEKDLQQLALIRQMIFDLDFPVEIVGHPIVREEDGLAMSSRNYYLDGHMRTNALCLFRALSRARDLVRESNAGIAIARLLEEVEAVINAHPDCTPEYIKVVDRHSLQPCERVDNQSVLALAVKINGKVRLIDNGLLCES